MGFLICGHDNLDTSFRADGWRRLDGLSAGGDPRGVFDDDVLALCSTLGMAA